MADMEGAMARRQLYITCTLHGPMLDPHCQQISKEMRKNMDYRLHVESWPGHTTHCHKVLTKHVQTTSLLGRPHLQKKQPHMHKPCRSPAPSKIKFVICCTVSTSQQQRTASK